jgi:hypothetical protein
MGKPCVDFRTFVTQFIELLRSVATMAGMGWAERGASCARLGVPTYGTPK